MDSIAYIRQIQHRYKTQPPPPSPLSYSRSLLWLLLHLVSVKHLLNSDLNNTNISSASLHVAFLTIEFSPLPCHLLLHLHHNLRPQCTLIYNKPPPGDQIKPRIKQKKPVTVQFNLRHCRPKKDT